MEEGCAAFSSGPHTEAFAAIRAGIHPLKALAVEGSDRVLLDGSNDARSSSKAAPPTPLRDGFHLVPSHPINYGLDLTKLSKTSPRPTTINEIRNALDLAQDDHVSVSSS